MDKSVLKRRLKLARQAANLSQEALGQKIHRDRSCIAKIELGDRDIRALELADWCAACGISPNTILNGESFSIADESAPPTEVAQ